MSPPGPACPGRDPVQSRTGSWVGRSCQRCCSEPRQGRVRCRQKAPPHTRLCFLCRGCGRPRAKALNSFANCSAIPRDTAAVPGTPLWNAARPRTAWLRGTSAVVEGGSCDVGSEGGGESPPGKSLTHTPLPIRGGLKALVTEAAEGASCIVTKAVPVTNSVVYTFINICKKDISRQTLDRPTDILAAQWALLVSWRAGADRVDKE